MILVHSPHHMTGTPGQTQHAPRRRSTLRRWIAPIACLFIGMVLSIVSGWVCMLAFRQPSGALPITGDRWSAPVAADWPSGVPVVRQEFRGRGWTQIQESYPNNSLQTGAKHMLFVVRSGFPCASAQRETWSVERATTGGGVSGNRQHTGYQVPRVVQRMLSGLTIPLLPIRPLFPGFALNTLIYAALTWCVLFAPGHLRRRRRLARNQCPACGYPIGKTTTCTECGEPVTPHTPRAPTS